MRSGQADMLDFVADNSRTGCREIYRDGRIKAFVARAAIARASLLAHFNATGPWESFPDAPALASPTEESFR